MHTSKHFFDLIFSFLLFVLSSTWHFIKLTATNTFRTVKKILNGIDILMCSTKYSFVFILIISFVLNISLEAALRKSIIKALSLVFTSPLVFFIGFLIILFTLSLCYLFKRRSFCLFFIVVVWSVINCVSFFMMLNRTTPFNASDLRILRSVSDIVTAYLSKSEIILIACGIIALIVILVFIFIKARKSKGLLSIVALIPLIIGCFTATAIYFNIKYNITADRFDNLPNKFKEHGFVFCFFYSIIDMGIEKPADYSEQTYVTYRNEVNSKTPDANVPEIHQSCSENDLIREVYNVVLENYEIMPTYEFYGIPYDVAETVSQHLKEEFENSPNLSTDDHTNHVSTFPETFDLPNIIFVQLESFYDVNNIEGYRYSREPHPIYSLMKQHLPGGKLTVPSIGAGTANTEFEVLTGMDVSLFGIAEYPYLSALQSQTCESMAYNAKEYGYSSHVVHNHRGTFYDRHKVFPNLGFDTFTSIENIPHMLKNRNNWAKDATLISPILQCLDSSEGQDLVYTISVQPHGKYPSESKYKGMLKGEEPFVKVSGNADNPENHGFTYYVNELYEADNFIGNLLLELSFRDEPTVLIMFGDHLPAFSVQQYWDLKEGNCYQTDYFIWNNCNIDFSDATDLKTYQLSSYVFSKLGIVSGDFNQLNSMFLQNDTDDYMHIRHIYQYAMLYDNNLKNNDKLDIPHYEKSDIKYGIFEADITDIFTIEGTSYIQGNNFTTYSRITVNGKHVDTDFITSSLISTDKKLSPDDEIGVVHLSKNNVVLGNSTNTMKYSDLMTVTDSGEIDTILKDILPSDDSMSKVQEQFFHHDATTDFETADDELSMIQPDISHMHDNSDSTEETPVTDEQN